MAHPRPQDPQRDIAYATTRDGHVLPVIDVTHPRFTVEDDPESVHRLYQAFLASERKQRRIPKFIMGLLLRRAARRSPLLKALFSPAATYLDGISTYVMKLGEANLPPPFDGPIDRRLAASPHIALLRLRLQQTSRLIAEGLVDDLAKRRARRCILSISAAGRRWTA